MPAFERTLNSITYRIVSYLANNNYSSGAHFSYPKRSKMRNLTKNFHPFSSQSMPSDPSIFRRSVPPFTVSSFHPFLHFDIQVVADIVYTLNVVAQTARYQTVADTCISNRANLITPWCFSSVVTLARPPILRPRYVSTHFLYDFFLIFLNLCVLF